MEESMPADSVYIRILEPVWSDAMAAGLKMVETQRYRHHSMNSMKFARKGTMLAFGTSDFLQGLAILDGPASTKCGHDEFQTVLEHVHEDFHGALLGYLRSGPVFDYVVASEIHDLRHCRLSWQRVWDEFPTKKAAQSQGFPKIGGLGLYLHLLQFAGEHAIP
jgi:hypothetical protein